LMATIPSGCDLGRLLNCSNWQLVKCKPLSDI